MLVRLRRGVFGGVRGVGAALGGSSDGDAGGHGVGARGRQRGVVEVELLGVRAGRAGVEGAGGGVCWKG